MKIKKINLLLMLNIFLLTIVCTKLYASNTPSPQGNYFLIGTDVDQVYKLSFKPNNQVIVADDFKVPAQWLWQAQQQIMVNFSQPQTRYQFPMSENETYVHQLIGLSFSTNTQEPSEYTQHMQVWHKEAQMVVQTYTLSDQGLLVKQRQLKKWQTQLVNTTWEIANFDEVTHAEVDWFKASSSASVTFHEDGKGTVNHWDNTQSDLTWKLTGKKLVLHYYRNEQNVKLVIRIVENIDDIGLRFVAKQVNKKSKQAKWLSGFMIEKQDVALTDEQIIGQWRKPNGRFHDYYPDQIAVASVANTASKWKLNHLNQLVREKLEHPEQGVVLNCPDNRCYVSCEFFYELLAKKGNTLYIAYHFNSEFYPQGPLKLQGKWIIKVEYDEAFGINDFSRNIFASTAMNLEYQDQIHPYLFQRLPDESGNLVNKVITPEGTGTFSVIEGKLHTVINQQESIFEITEFARDGLSVCQYQSGEHCSLGKQAIFKFDHEAGPYPANQ
ncbi:hypothetical protein [Pseudoalteromonas luteoviolacea]|uniref:Uncharacterized protein n=1 Tax=Pseudoalteromonas luteoviolacea H33 TaxID=1365251 RepID=A0A167DVE7_9GAMM|nr:hypothetical protein [Pseudoalteromonas luteoviolacea]KZN49413.1 hypothetical protein N476_19190 [Pseudoalteromonas luteoviolacea H33]KZN72654.1 hypothetical protein N477_24990 [Pseudoalteromonas luteoviolacea H33-S]MBQ4876292.1 hypothetical protein [Pseudoalteromonas luteoviolacea]MBQ4906325.1 hypothetical protein [Pseudoalteromonas luteoviolacea]